MSNYSIRVELQYRCRTIIRVRVELEYTCTDPTKWVAKLAASNFCVSDRVLIFYSFMFVIVLSLRILVQFILNGNALELEAFFKLGSNHGHADC